MTLDYSWLSEVDGKFPGPGRRHADLHTARDLLVAAPHFTASESRGHLWEGLERYLARFAELGHHYHVQPEGIVRSVWLAGSFVSTKLNPENIDLSVVVDGAARDAIKGRRGARWLNDAFDRDDMLSEFGLSPLQITYRPVVSPFRLRTLPVTDRLYFEQRGGWDDWWQRLRDPGAADGAPSLSTVDTKRGYMEVTL